VGGNLGFAEFFNDACVNIINYFFANSHIKRNGKN
jgi:hypothetical protein